MTMSFKSQSDVLCRTGPALADAGPNARPRRGAPLSNDIMALWRHRAQSTVLRPFCWRCFSKMAYMSIKKTEKAWYC